MRFSLLILSALIVCAYAQNTTTLAPTTDSNQGTTSTAVPPTTAAPTTAAPTTAAPTTAAPTTAAQTTAAATTTAGSTTPAPTPMPPPKVGHFTVTNGTETCLMMEVAMQFTLSYNNSKGEPVKFIFNLVENATATGECATASDPSQFVNLTWPGYEVTFEFERLTSSKEYGLKCIAIQFDFENPETSTLVGGDAFTGQIDKDTEYVISQGGSYMCKAEKSITFVNVTITSGGPLIGVTMSSEVSGFRYETFHEISGGKYSTEEECSADFSTSDIVPIAVGCALAALVVIVLIAYLIGRRRSRQKGYQSV